MKLTILNIIIYFLSKYFLLSIVTVLLNVGSSFFNNNIIDVVTYLFFMFVLPLGFPMAIILTYPMYLINKVKTVKFALLSLLGVFVVEIFIYYLLASQHDYKSLLINFVIGVALWLILFLNQVLKKILSPVNR